MSKVWEAIVNKLEIENEILRSLLWSRHGCSFPALYGDDGEMQCNVCMLDFKRDSAQKITETFTEMGMKKMREYTKELGKEENK